MTGSKTKALFVRLFAVLLAAFGWAVAFNPGGRSLAPGGDDATVWELPRS